MATAGLLGHASIVHWDALLALHRGTLLDLATTLGAAHYPVTATRTPAAEVRGRGAPHLEAAQALLAGLHDTLVLTCSSPGCGTAPGSPSPGTASADRPRPPCMPSSRVPPKPRSPAMTTMTEDAPGLARHNMGRPDASDFDGVLADAAPGCHWYGFAPVRLDADGYRGFMQSFLDAFPDFLLPESPSGLSRATRSARCTCGRARIRRRSSVSRRRVGRSRPTLLYSTNSARAASSRCAGLRSTSSA